MTAVMNIIWNRLVMIWSLSCRHHLFESG